MARNRFKLSCIASSRGSYVARAHADYERKEHEHSKALVREIMKPRYYIKCRGKIYQITETEAAMRRLTLSVITR